MQKKTEELIQNSSKLTEANDLITSFKEVQNTQEDQIKLLKEEIEQAKVAYKKVNSAKEGLDKEILTLREASKNSTEEVRRLSGSVSSKDVELDSLRTDLSSLSSQLNQLKDVIDQQENEAQDKENRLVTEHKRDGLSLRLEIFLENLFFSHLMKLFERQKFCESLIFISNSVSLWNFL